MSSNAFSFSSKDQTVKNRLVWSIEIALVAFVYLLLYLETVGDLVAAAWVFLSIGLGFLIDLLINMKYREAAFGVVVVKEKQSPLTFRIRLILGATLSFGCLAMFVRISMQIVSG